ncbi:MAG: GNAT family N-acetyltransferase [Cyanobacteria bacterium J06629_18]
MTQKLLSSRLILRELEPSDLTAVFNYSSQPEYAKFLTHPHATSIEDFKPIFEDIISSQEDNYLWGICLSSNHQLIGMIQITIDEPTQATLHYEIAPQFWNKGFATEAVTTVITWIFENLPQINCINGDTHFKNLGSQRVMEKSGMNRIKIEVVNWEKFPEPVELVYYQIKRP